MHSPSPTRHLDLGCGRRPRNPYRRDEVYGVDLRNDLEVPGVSRIAAANLSLEPIPFDDNLFDSVSAYDFFEHVPRVSLDHGSGSNFFPFILLMNEIWRVLKPGGLLYAVTPAYPHEKAFRDPTHVNILSKKSHRYFTTPRLEARMYGFIGEFELVRQTRVYVRGDYEPNPPSVGRWMLRLVDTIAGKRSHLVWEMRVRKPDL
ncbi:MAG: methyltransferase domain-containing protein [Thiotrichales bacterium]